MPWLVTPTRAEAPKDGSYLDLQGQVELMSMPRDGSPPTVISTTRLMITPDEFSAVTDQPVEVTVGENRLQAVGLKTHLKGDSVELESKVHGRFAP